LRRRSRRSKPAGKVREIAVASVFRPSYRFGGSLWVSRSGVRSELWQFTVWSLADRMFLS
jgi:hypothetical protein